tara:strand:- start:490 stop:723 length:234 start_codon:yes stop_codon:yes gene_type:complete
MTEAIMRDKTKPDIVLEKITMWTSILTPNDDDPFPTCLDELMEAIQDADLETKILYYCTEHLELRDKPEKDEDKEPV